MKRHATTLLLLLAAVLLGVWLWLDRGKVTEGERSLRGNNVFPAWRKEDLSRIEIVHEGETIVLERDGTRDNAWRMRSPLDERVDQAAIERLQTTLEFATVVRKMAAGAAEDEHTLGFDRPRASAVITMGTLVFRVALGGAAPRPEGAGYLRVDQGIPFVASKELVDTLLARAETYRDRTVVPYLSLEIASFEVKHPAGGFAVDRSDARSFKVRGLGILAGRAALDKVWSALAEMRAEAFPKDADADRATANPVLTITMTSKESGKPPGELVVGEACPGHPSDVVVLRKQPTRTAACAPRGAIDALLATTPGSLVDRRPFSFRHDEVEELRLERIGDGGGAAAGGDAGAPPRAIELARRGPGFHQREPADRELSPEEADAASELLALVERIAAEDVKPGGEAFAATARARVRSGEHEETVEVGSAGDAGKSVLRRLRDDARLTVSHADARKLTPRRTTLKPRAILTDPRRVTRVNLRCGVAQDLVDSGAGLALVSPAGYETDGSIVQLVDGVKKGKALLWTADADDGSFGLGGADPCRFVLAFEDNSAPVTVRFGSEGEGGVYAMVEGSPDVLVAPPSLKSLATRIYVSHGSLRVAREKVESVKVTEHGRPVTVVPAEALRDAAAGLYADRVVALGKDKARISAPEIEILIAVAEGGPPKRVLCGPKTTSPRLKGDQVVGVHPCVTPGVDALFEVAESHLARFLTVPDGGPLTPPRGRP